MGRIYCSPHRIVVQKNKIMHVQCLSLCLLNITVTCHDCAQCCIRHCTCIKSSSNLEGKLDSRVTSMVKLPLLLSTQCSFQLPYFSEPAETKHTNVWGCQKKSKSWVESRGLDHSTPTSATAAIHTFCSRHWCLPSCRVAYKTWFKVSEVVLSSLSMWYLPSLLEGCGNVWFKVSKVIFPLLSME